MFEKSSAERISLKFADLRKQDCILIPCNPARSCHWFLLAILPKQDLVIALDSAANNSVKPTIKQAMEKCQSILSLVEPGSHWEYYTNSEADVPQQDNCQDCGVFVCLFGRVLALEDNLPQSSRIPDFRLMMLIDLHQHCLSPISAHELQLESYYAVDYVSKFYIGRLIKVEGRVLTFKFLHPFQSEGVTLYDWPRRDDLDDSTLCCVFYGPIHLSGCGPFTVSNLQEITQLFSFIKKCGTKSGT